MKILGIIPARGGSKGITKKNIKLLNGKHLIAYTIEAALASNLERVIVSTECSEIANISLSYGAEIIMRPMHLAEDESPTLPVLQDVVSKLNEKYDAVMTLQPTSPFRTIDDINNSIELFENDKEADCLVSVVKVPHNYSPEKLMDYDGKYLHGNCNVNRRQDVQTLYARNGAAISITKTKRLGEYIFGGNILPYFMNKLNSIDIDDMEDWNIAEGLF
jgi:CMP-N,N'-diacetyllegionaminic acid synthase|tara:strand:- start:131 stop:784 length:654 start_codon:yes stop_codon:yes gene_type:complete